MDVDEVSENPENIEDQNLIFYDRQRRMTDKTSSICLKIKIRIQMLIILQTKKIYHGKGQKIYAVNENYSLNREFPEDKRKSRSPSKYFMKIILIFLRKNLIQI